MPDNTRRIHFTAQQFIDDPSLYAKVQSAWEGKQWYALFGEWPKDGRVMADLPEDGGIVFYYRPQERPKP